MAEVQRRFERESCTITYRVCVFCGEPLILPRNYENLSVTRVFGTQEAQQPMEGEGRFTKRDFVNLSFWIGFKARKGRHSDKRGWRATFELVVISMENLRPDPRMEQMRRYLMLAVVSRDHVLYPEVLTDLC